MITVKIELELTYDDDIAHGTDGVATDWFYNDILRGDHLALWDEGELGDRIGKAQVLTIRPK